MASVKEFFLSPSGACYFLGLTTGLLVSLPPNGGPHWFSPTEGLYGVTAAQAAVQNFKAFDQTGLLLALLAQEWPVVPFG